MSEGLPARVLIAGCGDVGTRLGLELCAAGVDVYGLSRRAAPPAPIRPLRADLTDPTTLVALPPVDAVVFVAAPSTRDEAGYRALFVAGLGHLLDALPRPPSRLLFVSSTAVWGGSGGAWVDEQTPCVPDAFNGRVLLEAEALAAARVAGAVALRLGGLYGPGRDALIRSVRARAPCQAEPPLYTHRIHVLDAARAIAHLLALPAPAPIYAGVDDDPAPQCEVLDWLAARLGLPPAPRSTGEPLPSKRVSNRRLRASGFAFRYPGYRDGYAELLPPG